MLRLLALTLLAPLAAQSAELPRVITPDGAQNAPPLLHSLAPPGPGLRPALLKQVLEEAARQGVPPDLADAVAVVETGYTPQAVGRSGEIGLMQVMPGTAAGLGFHGSLDELADPATNIHYGVSYLAKAWASAGGNPCRALMKYRAGVSEEGYSPLSLQYCHHAATWLATAQSAMAQAVADTTPAEANIADAGGGFGGGGGFDLHDLPAIAGIPTMVVTPGRVTSARRTAPADLARVQAALDDAMGGNEDDEHVVHMPASAD